MTSTNLDQALQAACQHFQAVQPQQLTDWLQQLIPLQACAFPGHDAARILPAAEAVARLLRDCGLPEVELITDSGPQPAVWAQDLQAGSQAPTLLCYAHYDVQPQLDAAGWHSPADQGELRDGRLYGRGSADDLAGIVAIAAAYQAWRQAGGLPCNLRIIIEGQEEIGSPDLELLVQQHRQRLQADAIVILDVGNVASGLPTLTTSLRGMVAGSVRVQGLAGPVHSGMWGGAVPDAAAALVTALASVTDQDGKVCLPGLPAGTVSARAWDDCQQLPFDQQQVQQDAGITADWQPAAADLYRRSWYQPHFAINAIHAGGPPGQAGNVINDQAWARFSLRIVPGCDPEAAQQALAAHLQRHLQDYDVSWDWETAAAGWAADLDHPIMQAALDALAAGYGRNAVLGGCGGSIPLVHQLQHALGGVPVLLYPVEDPASNAHGYNESVNLADLTATSASLIHLAAKLVASSSSDRGTANLNPSASSG